MGDIVGSQRVALMMSLDDFGNDRMIFRKTSYE